MKGYLGEKLLKQEDTEFKDYASSDWALYFIEMYSGIDGDHHNAWLLDQLARILKGTPIKIYQAKWKNGSSEFRIMTGEVSEEYVSWLADIGRYGGIYSTGIVP